MIIEELLSGSARLALEVIMVSKQKFSPSPHRADGLVRESDISPTVAEISCQLRQVMRRQSPVYCESGKQDSRLERNGI